MPTYANLCQPYSGTREEIVCEGSVSGLSGNGGDATGISQMVTSQDMTKGVESLHLANDAINEDDE